MNYYRRCCVKRKERNYNNPPKPLLIYPPLCSILLSLHVSSLPVMTHSINIHCDSYMTHSTQPLSSRNQGNTCINNICENALGLFWFPIGISRSSISRWGRRRSLVARARYTPELFCLAVKFTFPPSDIVHVCFSSRAFLSFRSIIESDIGLTRSSGTCRQSVSFRFSESFCICTVPVPIAHIGSLIPTYTCLDCLKCQWVYST
jgi:hypothetical protein